MKIDHQTALKIAKALHDANLLVIYARFSREQSPIQKTADIIAAVHLCCSCGSEIAEHDTSCAKCGATDFET